MKKTVNVNLNGRMFTIDEDAYRLLDNYLQNLKIYFRKEEGSAEIISDFEARIGELFCEYISRGFQVIDIVYVEEVIARVGRPADFMDSEDSGFQAGAGAGADASSEAASADTTKRKFFRNGGDKMIGGICSGISAYFGWDVLPVRIVFFVLIFFTSLWIIPAYLLAWILVPEAKTVEQKLQMRGRPVTVENIGRAVAEEEKPKSSEQKGCLTDLVNFLGGFLKFCFIALCVIIAIPLIFTIIILLTVLFAVLFGLGTGLGGLLPFGIMDFITGNSFISVAHPVLATTTFILVLLIPLIVIFYNIIAYFAKFKPVHPAIKWAGFLIWLVALIMFFTSGFRINFDRLHHPVFFSEIHNCLDGNDIHAEREKLLAPVESVSIDNGLIACLKIQQVEGDSSILLFSGNENLIDNVNLEESDGHLRLSAHKKNCLNSDDNLTITLKTGALKKIELSSAGKILINEPFLSEDLEIRMKGVGSIHADSLIAKRINVDAEGAGSITLQGKAVYADLKMEGIGAIDAARLLSDSVYARMEGIGNISCNPVDYLNANMNGIGQISYVNEPKTKHSTVVGLGKVKRE